MAVVPMFAVFSNISNLLYINIKFSNRTCIYLWKISYTLDGNPFDLSKNPWRVFYFREILYANCKSDLPLAGWLFHI